MPTTQRTTPYEVITARILTLLEQGTVPWHRPWDSATGMPRNLFSQRAYRGINVWLLTAMGYASPFWATFQQVKTAGGSVRKGERGVPVVFWKVYHRDDPETGDGGEALRPAAVYGLQRRAARRRGRPGDHRARAPLHAHRAVCPSGGRHAAASDDPARASARLLHARHGYPASAAPGVLSEPGSLLRHRLS